MFCSWSLFVFFLYAEFKAFSCWWTHVNKVWSWWLKHVFFLSFFPVEGSVCIKANAQSCGECIQVSESCGWCSDIVSWITESFSKLFFFFCHVNEKYYGDPWLWLIQSVGGLVAATPTLSNRRQLSGCVGTIADLWLIRRLKYPII